MTDTMNGAHTADDLPAIDEKEDPAVVTSRVDAAVDAQVINPLGIMVRGILHSSNDVPHAILMQSIARCMGRLLATSVAGNPIPVTTKAREDFRSAFAAGIKMVPLMQAANMDEVIKRAVKLGA